jgi:hypothetical protein
MKNLNKLEKLTETKLEKLNKKWNLGSASYVCEIKENSVRIYNENDSLTVSSQKELNSWIAQANKMMRNSID